MLIDSFATGIQHVGLPCRNLDQTTAFYKGLGFKIVLQTVNAQANQRVVFLQLGNMVIEAYEAADACGKAGAIDHIAMGVTDIEAVFSIIRAGDYQMLDSKVRFLHFWENGVKFFTIEGPSAEKIEFIQKL